MKEECANVKKSVLEETIANLPAEQQQAVRTCFSASRAKSKKGIRYSLEWIYQCLLMRIKSKSLYEDIRTRNILPMPSNETLQKYIGQISSSSFGFQTSIFNCLKEKGSRMEYREKRGNIWESSNYYFLHTSLFLKKCAYFCCKKFYVSLGTLLIDEMSLSKGVHFNSRTLKMSGFVDFGDHTPDHLKNVRADHALVFMFQPFVGKWVQVLGSFLSHNQVTGDILQKLIVECVILLENAGFHVDVVTSDGASWNRKVWTEMGINEKNITCPHPCNSQRELFMVSDFPHLIKTFRNKIMEGSKPFWTPVGMVKKEDWETLIAIDKPDMANLSAAFKLTPDHLNPKGYQKMNVPMAFDVSVFINP